jgi:DNA-directed RNA polymerase subunit alpha
MRIVKSTTGLITAADIEADAAITIINKEQVIATLTRNIEFSLEMTVERGRGYVPAADEDTHQEQEIGVIPIDAIFSPVVRVRYKTEETRVGQKINYDRLIMEIWTNGTITPEMALVESAKILRKHLGPFIQYFEVGEKFAESYTDTAGSEEGEVVDEELGRKLSMPISELDLTVRSANCLEMAKCDTVGQLAAMTESQLLALRSFGKSSLREVKRKLADLGLTLGMTENEG